MRTRFNLLLVLKAAIVLVFCMALSWSLRHRPGSRISPEHAEQIAVGMTFQEAIAIIGDPPGDYTTLPEDELDYSLPGPGEVRWSNDEFSIVAVLDDHGKVAEVYHVPSWARFYRTAKERPLWWRVRDWLGF